MAEVMKRSSNYLLGKPIQEFTHSRFVSFYKRIIQHSPRVERILYHMRV